MREVSWIGAPKEAIIDAEWSLNGLLFAGFGYK